MTRLLICAGLLALLIAKAAASDMPLGRIVDVPDFVPDVDAQVYLPTTYDKQLPAPIMFLENYAGQIEGETFRRITTIAEELGWIAVCTKGFLSDEETRQVFTACEQRFAVHPFMRFTTSYWNRQPRAVSPVAQRVPMLAADVGICSHRIEAIPPEKTILWLTCGRNLSERKEPGMRGNTVRNFVCLAARGWPVRMDQFDGTQQAPADVLNDGVHWMVRTYLRRGGRLLPTDRARVADFMALEMEKAEQYRKDGRLYKAFEIAEELQTIKGPLQEPFHSLYNELAASPDVRADVRLREGLQVLIKTAAAAYDRNTVAAAREVSAPLGKFLLGHSKSYFAPLIGDIKSDLDTRIEKGEM